MARSEKVDEDNFEKKGIKALVRAAARIKIKEEISQGWYS
jgi:hypothetical protein